MRKAGHRILWKNLKNEPGLIGTIRTHSCTYGDQALILRGYDRLTNDEGPFTVLQEWRCEPAGLVI